MRGHLISLENLGLLAGNLRLVLDSPWTVCVACVIFVCKIVVLGVMRPKMAIDFGSKEVEPRLVRELSMDSPHTVFRDC